VENIATPSSSRHILSPTKNGLGLYEKGIGYQPRTVDEIPIEPSYPPIVMNNIVLGSKSGDVKDLL